MLSGEGNAGERWKNSNRSNYQKSNFARVAHFFCTFLCRCFARLQRQTSRNFFMEEMSYVFSFPFFFTPLIFSLHWWPLALSPPLQNFHVVLPTKKFLLCFLSLALDLCPPFSLWVSLACRFFSFSLSFSYSISKFVDMTINRSL